MINHKIEDVYNTFAEISAALFSSAKCWVKAALVAPLATPADKDHKERSVNHRIAVISYKTTELNKILKILSIKWSKTSSTELGYKQQTYLGIQRRYMLVMSKFEYDDQLIDISQDMPNAPQ